MEEIDWQSLTKKERRRLKKELEKAKKVSQEKKKRLLKWGFVLGAIFLIVGGFFLFRFLNEKRMSNAPRLEVVPQSFDFGKISLAKGAVQTSFTVKNNGVSKLVIREIRTSCDCTSAKLKMEDKESPLFGMHTQREWSATLEPGKEAQLTVIYDPKVHPESGPVSRVVSVFSNDPWQKEKKITIWADVQS